MTAREESRFYVGSIDLRACTISYAEGCPGCGGEPPAPRRRWCSQECVDRYISNHDVRAAAEAAIRRDGGQCVKCGSSQNVEANHIEPLRGQRRATSCLNHLDGLETLCRKCHVRVTRLQRWPESVELDKQKAVVAQRKAEDDELTRAAEEERRRMQPSFPGMAE